jgi:hypothetical protein
MRLAEHITVNFNNMSMAAVFFDIEKAFTTTWHSGLLHELSELEFSTSHIKLTASSFIHSFIYFPLIHTGTTIGYIKSQKRS